MPKPTTLAEAQAAGWVYEDELPETFREYDQWYERSAVIEGVRMGPHWNQCELDEVVQIAQAILTALNVGDVQKDSKLHLKLREVMIAYRKKAGQV